MRGRQTRDDNGEILKRYDQASGVETAASERGFIGEINNISVAGTNCIVHSGNFAHKSCQ